MFSVSYHLSCLLNLHFIIVLNSFKTKLNPQRVYESRDRKRVLNALCSSSKIPFHGRATVPANGKGNYQSKYGITGKLIPMECTTWQDANDGWLIKTAVKHHSPSIDRPPNRHLKSDELPDLWPPDL